MDPSVLATKRHEAQARARRKARSVAERTGADATLLDVSYPQDKAVEALYRDEALADFLADLDSALSGMEKAEPSATSITPDFLNTTQRQSLVNAGYDSDEAVLAASDEDLIALDGVGPKTVEDYRKAFA